MADRADAVLFDLDNTLVDDDYATRAGLRAFHGVYGSELGWPFEILLDYWRQLLDVYYPQYLTGALSLAEHRRKRVLDLFRLAGRELTPAEADAAFAVYRAEYARSWRLFPEVTAALDALRGHRMAVLTNGSLESQGEKMAASGLTGYFENLYASADLGVAKPSAAVFWKVCERMGVEPSRCVHVGDRLDVDARGAQAAGLRSVWLNRSKTAGADASAYDGITIRTLLELVPLLQGST